MPTNADDRLIEIREKLRAKRKLESSLLEARKSLAAEKERLKELGIILAKEEADVRRLEGLSLTAMFSQFLGSREDRLDKERQEVFAAKLKHDRSAHEVASLERDVEKMADQVASLGDPEAEYDRVLREKEPGIDEAGRKAVVQWTEKLAEINSDVKEIGEAVAAGSEVIAGLDDVIASFQAASNWGIVDLVGGGLIVTAVKHAKIDRAKAAINDVQTRIGRFKRELADLRTGSDSPLKVEISSFEKFADFLFDGLIFDWIVQSKIRRSLDAARDMRAKIANMVENLRAELSAKQKAQREAERERRAAVESG